MICYVFEIVVSMRNAIDHSGKYPIMNVIMLFDTCIILCPKTHQPHACKHHKTSNILGFFKAHNLSYCSAAISRDAISHAFCPNGHRML